MAATGLYPAFGEAPRIAEVKPSSAFSRGDILMLDSNSSLSRIDELFPAGADIFGIALTDSVDSVRDRCTVAVPMADSVFVSIATAGSAWTEGEEVDFDVDANGRPVVVTSANSARAVIVRSEAQVLDQSVQSRVFVKLIRHAGNIELS